MNIFKHITTAKTWTIRAFLIFLAAYGASIVTALVLIPDCPFTGDYVPACAPLADIGLFFGIAAILGCAVMTFFMFRNKKPRG